MLTHTGSPKAIKPFPLQYKGIPSLLSPCVQTLYWSYSNDLFHLAEMNLNPVTVTNMLLIYSSRKALHIWSFYQQGAHWESESYTMIRDRALWQDRGSFQYYKDPCNQHSLVLMPQYSISWTNALLIPKYITSNVFPSLTMSKFFFLINKRNIIYLIECLGL